ncbi:hypothetical protein K438DRAFT_1980778 [Mycena galopus ATCC 62051]|nr:hypothetical protein K438DRAFT_1980778 [Mycena galopus ATCC 62051]
MSSFSPKVQELSALELAVATAAERHEQISRRSDGNYTRLFHLGDFGCTSSPSRAGTRRLTCPGWCTTSTDQTAGGTWVRTVDDDELCRKAAEAVLWLRAQRMDVFGSLGGAETCHTVFQGGKAPEPFTSVAAAQTYLNAAVGRVQHRHPSWMPPIAQLSFVGEDVVLTQSDMDASNFGVALDGRPVVFDAATIQALPKTLANYTLLRTTEFATAVSAHIFDAGERAALLASPNFASLAAARKHLFMGNDDLGVDADGNLKITATRASESQRARSSSPTNGL